MGTTLKHLLARRHLQEHSEFCREYNRVARTLDRQLAGTAPSKAQYYRWLNGELQRQPHSGRCRVLEAMLPGYTIEQLFSPCGEPDAALPPAEARGTGLPVPAGDLAGLTSIYLTRSQFTDDFPPQVLLGETRDIRMAGLSLNLLCQQFPDRQLRRLVLAGTRLRALFLDPAGEATGVYEREEGYTHGKIATLTELNIETLRRLRDSLPADVQDRLALALYDETPRFNLTILDGRRCVAQPYVPRTRGIDSPTMVIDKQPGRSGLFDVFADVFASLQERSRPI